MPEDVPRHVVAIIGGATAGAEAAGILAERGVVSVVFEQHARPYGKIEDGLPRWHVKLRRKEYELINERLQRPLVLFVPLTKIGRDIQLPALAREWGFTAVLMANGAWLDRPLPVPGADRYVGRGLLYQNPFIYWFNHFPERGYSGPHYEVLDGSLVVGGGLASIDVIKILQIEAVRRALAARGIQEDTLRIEEQGIGAILSSHGLSWETLGLRKATLFYRRRIENMPLAEAPQGADESRLRRIEATRRRIIEKAMQKYLFDVRPLMMPVGLIVEDDRLAGLRFQRTRVEKGRAVPLEGETEDVRASLVVSSIGSIPEPMAGVDQEGGLYRFAGDDLCRLEGYENVFGIGNVVTGKGNIAASRKHSIQVTTKLVERFLGLEGGGHEGEEELLEPLTAGPRGAAERVGEWAKARPPLDPARARGLLERVRARQLAVGYDCPYREWIGRVTPPDLV